tara:strand:- start:210 stop:890 length:681 start_codon:yes stop_codon:yes gene_type:complete
MSILQFFTGKKILSPDEMDERFAGVKNVILESNKLIDDVENQVKNLMKINSELDNEIKDIEKTIHDKLSDEMKKVSNFKKALNKIKTTFENYKLTTLKNIHDQARRIISLEIQLDVLCNNPDYKKGKDAFNDIKSKLTDIRTEITKIETEIKDFHTNIETLKTSVLESLGESFGRNLINNLFNNSTKIIEEVDNNFALLNNINKEFEKNFKDLALHMGAQVTELKI